MFYFLTSKVLAAHIIITNKISFIVIKSAIEQNCT